MLMVPTHAVTLLSVQLTTGMNLPCISYVTLMLNLTMTTPLAQFHSCMNPLTANRRTSSLLSMQLSRRDGSACLAYMKFSAPRTDRTLV